MVQLSYTSMTTRKTIILTGQTYVSKVMSLLFNMLSRLVTALFPRSKCPSISWLRSPSTVILEAPENKVSHCFHCYPIYFSWGDGTRCLDPFECWVLSHFFHSPLSLSSRGSLVLLCFLHKGDVICISEVIDISPVQSWLQLVLHPNVLFIIRDWNAKLGTQEIHGVTSKFGLGVQMKQGKG